MQEQLNVTKKDTSSFDKLTLNEKAERYASWFGVYNNPEWKKLKDAFTEGYESHERVSGNMQELINKVQQWGLDRGITGKNAKATPMSQALKTMEELHETLKAINNNDRSEITDGIGDQLVTLILLCDLTGNTLEGCLEAAYDEIKDRKGSMENGTFVKEA